MGKQKYNIIEGNVYDSWTVISWNREKRKYLCRCECGAVSNKIASDVLKGGCCRKCTSAKNRMYKIEEGATYGAWTVLKLNHSKKQRAWRHLCKCKCGRESLHTGKSLMRRGACMHCCGKKHFLEVGKTYNQWTVLELDVEKLGHNMLHLCQCSCGETFKRSSHDIINTNSCLKCRSEDNRGENNKNFIHGETKSKLHYIWVRMRERCNREGHMNYKYYGGKGVKVCPEWETFLIFKEWAMKNGYEDGLTIERNDIDKGYTPENCRWATIKEQARNKSNNVMLTAFGETKCAADWADDPRCAVSAAVLRLRTKKYKWDDLTALTKPSRQHRRGNNG